MTMAHYKKIFLSAAITFLLCFYGIIYFNILNLAQYSSIIELLGIAISFPAFIICIQHHPKGQKSPWIWFGITAFLFFIGDALWVYLEYTTGQEPETPSICDIFYLANTLTCVIGIILYSLRNKYINLS